MWVRVRVPGQIVVHHDMARAMQVDALAANQDIVSAAAAEKIVAGAAVEIVLAVISEQCVVTFKT